MPEVQGFYQLRWQCGNLQKQRRLPLMRQPENQNRNTKTQDAKSTGKQFPK
jgi:hypothetical protein